MLLSELRSKKFKVDADELYEDLIKGPGLEHKALIRMQPKIKKLSKYFPDSTNVQLGKDWREEGFPYCIKFDDFIIQPCKQFHWTGKGKGYYTHSYYVSGKGYVNTFEDVIAFLKDRCGIGNSVLNEI